MGVEGFRVWGFGGVGFGGLGVWGFGVSGLGFGIPVAGKGRAGARPPASSQQPLSMSLRLKAVLVSKIYATMMDLGPQSHKDGQIAQW